MLWWTVTKKRKHFTGTEGVNYFILSRTITTPHVIHSIFYKHINFSVKALLSTNFVYKKPQKALCALITCLNFKKPSKIIKKTINRYVITLTCFIRTSTLFEKATLRTKMFLTLLKGFFWLLNSTSSSQRLDILKK